MAKIILKICAKDTLRAMQIGEEIDLPNSRVRPNAVRVAASELKEKENMLFECSEKNTITSIKVRRVK
ncbi:MAG: hypothetical protein LBV72_00390 [Tannerella sp.]|jgi:hypothetical protein|nr:hypothetical protein [Tannerella sp.]